MGNPLFEKPDGISWNPASLEAPPMPSIQPGEDSMSMTIAAALQVLSAEMAASMTSLQAKETMFSSRVVDAQSAYQNADDAGGQSVGGMGGQIGEIGKMAQQAGGAAGQGSGSGGGGGGVFSQLMEQAMKAVQGATEGAGGGESQGTEAQGASGQASPGTAPGAPAGQSSSGGSQSGEGQKGEAKGGAHQDAPERNERDRHQGQPTERAPLEQPSAAAAGPSERQHAAGRAPVSPPPPSPRGAGQDVSRDL